MEVKEKWRHKVAKEKIGNPRKTSIVFSIKKNQTKVSSIRLFDFFPIFLSLFLFQFLFLFLFLLFYAEKVFGCCLSLRNLTSQQSL
jgi:quinol-cytochrome oxidoreductase complex cytochrome b subunit